MLVHHKFNKRAKVNVVLNKMLLGLFKSLRFPFWIDTVCPVKIMASFKEWTTIYFMHIKLRIDISRAIQELRP